ncbi:MAG: hypothetical protein CFH36_01751 [Alphaproteobacteria bacterium MarineAlpha9_Bin6]|nr:MAG: hypothetical protein CFH36_01751 [Alphaproteobacteria bacterium MarineAlpha9_Bin6]
MKIGLGVAAVVALFASFASVPVTAAEILTLKASSGRFKKSG